MKQPLRTLLVAFALGLVLALPSPASAHDFRPGVLTLVEGADGYEVTFSPPIESTGDPATITVRFPPQCRQHGSRLACDAPGLAGELVIDGLRGRFMKTVVTLRRFDGTSEEWLLTAAAPRLTLQAMPHRAGGLPWLWLGVEHILGGLDHLAFVVGLLLVLELRFSRRLLFTISAFTVAHSVTLVLAALDVLRVPIAPVEACIALSVLLVAREATHREPTALRRWPWLAAGAFGLIHGLGFAAALREIGLPQGSLAWSLLWFNLGVEAGQLGVVALVVGLAALARRLPLVLERGVVHARVHRAAAYALGTIAAWWLLDRVGELARGG